MVGEGYSFQEVYQEQGTGVYKYRPIEKGRFGKDENGDILDDDAPVAMKERLTARRAIYNCLHSNCVNQETFLAKRKNVENVFLHEYHGIMNDNTLPELKTMNEAHTHQCSKEPLSGRATFDQQVAHNNVTASEKERMQEEIKEAKNNQAKRKQRQDQKENESVNVCRCCDDKGVSNCCLVNHERNTTERFF